MVSLEDEPRTPESHGSRKISPGVDRWKKLVTYLPVSEQGLFRHARNLSWLIGDRIFRMGLTLIVTALMSRYLGPAKFGLLNLARSFVAIFTPIAILGLDSIVPVYLVKYPRHASQILGSSTGLRIMGSLGACLLAGTLFYVMRFSDPMGLILVLVIGPGFLFQSAETIDALFQTRIKAKLSVIPKAFGFVTACLWRVYLVFMGAGVLAFGIAIPMEFLISSTSLAVSCDRRGIPFKSWQIQQRTMRLLLRRGVPLTVAGLFTMINLSAGQVIVGKLLGDEAIGLYSASVQVSSLLYYVPWIVIPAVFPVLVRSRDESPERYQKLVQMLFVFLTWLGVLFALTISLGSGFLTSFIFGSKFSSAAGALSLQVWASVLFFQMILSSYWMVNENLEKIALVFSGLSAVLNIMLNLVLVPSLGIKGAAWAAVASYGAPSLLWPFFFPRCRRLGFMAWAALLAPWKAFVR